MKIAPAVGAALRRRRGRWGQAASFAAGVALLAGAITAVSLRWGTLAAQWDSGGHGAPWAGGRWGLVAAAVLLPVVNWLCTSGAFWVVTRRYGRVGLVEMSALIATSSLLNYLPLRPGLLGRVAYHKAVNGIGVRQSILALLAVLGCSAVAWGIFLAAAFLAGGDAGTAASGVAVGTPGLALGGAWAMAWAKDRRWACYAGAAFFRYLDMAAWTGRYSVAFALCGAPLGLGTAAVIASISQIVTLLPLAGNGLGFQEWGVAYSARWLGAAAREVGLAAGLVSRAGELLAAVAVGLAGWVWVTRRLARLNREGAAGATDAADNLQSV